MDPELTIVLLGTNGVGKSASANTILGRAAFKSKTSFKAVTTAIGEEMGRVFGKWIRVMDTPGILGLEQQLKSRCRDVLGSSGSHLFLLVLSLGRFTADQEEALRAAVNVVGPRGLEKSFLLFTGGDLLKDQSLKDFLCESANGSLSEIIEQFDEAYHLFNNKDGGQEQVRELLQKAGHLPAGEPEIRMVLVGKCGAGISAVGNTILGRKAFRSSVSRYSVTSECQKETGEFEGQKLTLVDTPGLLHTCKSEEEVVREISRCISFVAPGPHVFLVVIQPFRFTQKEQKTMRILQQLFGVEAARYTVTLFTYGDYLEEDGVTIEKVISDQPALSAFIRQCGGRYHVFNNRDRDLSQVRELLKKINSMVQRNAGRYYNNEILEEAERETRIQQQQQCVIQ